VDNFIIDQSFELGQPGEHWNKMYLAKDIGTYRFDLNDITSIFDDKYNKNKNKKH